MTFAPRVTKVMAWSLGKAMSTLVVQECYLWHSLAEMSDIDEVRFLDAPISQSSLLGDPVDDSASSSQQYKGRLRLSSTSCPSVILHLPLLCLRANPQPARH